MRIMNYEFGMMNFRGFWERRFKAAGGLLILCVQVCVKTARRISPILCLRFERAFKVWFERNRCWWYGQPFIQGYSEDEIEEMRRFAELLDWDVELPVVGDKIL